MVLALSIVFFFGMGDAASESSLVVSLIIFVSSAVKAMVSRPLWRFFFYRLGVFSSPSIIFFTLLPFCSR